MSAFDTLRLESENARLRDLVRELADACRAGLRELDDYVLADLDANGQGYGCYSAPQFQTEGTRDMLHAAIAKAVAQAALDKARGGVMGGFVLFSGYTLDDAKLCVGPGWHPLLEQAFERIARVPGAVVVQVKEKYGWLRINVEGADRELGDYLWELEQKISVTVCEFCGKPGRRRFAEKPDEYVWIKTRCDDCQAKWLQQRDEDRRQYKERQRHERENA